MLGSHFDLAREIKSIAAKRGVESNVRPTASAPAFEDFDRRISAFLETVSPILVNSDARQDFASLPLNDDRG